MTTTDDPRHHPCPLGESPGLELTTPEQATVLCLNLRSIHCISWKIDWGLLFPSFAAPGGSEPHAVTAPREAQAAATLGEGRTSENETWFSREVQLRLTCTINSHVPLEKGPR